MSWYEHSKDWIDVQRYNNPDMTHDELKKHCKANYPFAQRSGWAYKAWLMAMQSEFGKRDTSSNKDMLKGD